MGGRRTIVATAFGIALLVVASTCGLAQAAGESGKGPYTNYTVSEYAFGKLERAHKLLAEEKYAEARRELDEMSQRRGLNPHEQAVMYQTYGYIESSQEQYRKAAASFEKCLALHALPEGAQTSTLYNLAQIYLADQRFDKAAATLESWFKDAENPGAEAYYLLAVAYMQDDKPARALAPAKRAVEKSDQPKEAWIQLLLALYLEDKSYSKAVGLLEQLIARWPKKAYWMQLSAVYAELGREEDSLAAMQLAYTQGMLETDSELRNLARMYMYQQIPYRAAKVLEKGMADGGVKPDAKAWELLADAWLNAREFKKALDPLRKAAQASGDGELYLRLARIYVDQQLWDKAADAANAALAKPGLKDRGKAMLLLGIVHYSNGHHDQALAAFEKARTYDAQRKEADAWIAHIKRSAKAGE